MITSVMTVMRCPPLEEDAGRSRQLRKGAGRGRWPGGDAAHRGPGFALGRSAGGGKRGRRERVGPGGNSHEGWAADSGFHYAPGAGVAWAGARDRRADG